MKNSYQMMTEFKYRQESPSAQKNRPTAKSDQTDRVKVVESINLLNITRRNVAAYPEGHQLVSKSLESAFRSLRSCNQTRSGLSIGAAGDVLLFDSETLGPRNSACRDFAAALYQRNIAAVSFLPGLDRQELLQFITLLTIPLLEITALGGIEKILKNYFFNHIIIRPTDYSVLRFTPQSETVPPGRVKETDTDELLHSFTSDLMSGVSSTSPWHENVPNREGLRQPEILASLINTEQAGANVFLQNYQKTLSLYFEKKKTAAATGTECPERLTGINDFLQALDPKNRRHFLATTLQLCSVVPISSGVESFFTELDHELAMEMLFQGNKNGVEISPSLINFLQKFMHSFGSDTRDSDLNQGMERSPPTSHLRDLFHREEFEHYVTEDYAQVLTKLANTPLLEEGIAVEEFPLREYLVTLDDQYLNNRIARIFLALMNDEESEEGYQHAFAMLSPIIDSSLDHGDFSLLNTILQALILHRKSKPNPKLKTVAWECLQSFESPLFLARALAAVDAHLDQVSQAPILFLSLLGDAVIPGLLDLYLVKQDETERHAFLHILENFQDKIAIESQNRLASADPGQAIILLGILSKWGNQDTVQFLKNFLDTTPNLMIKKEIFASLLTLRDQWALDSLEEFLLSAEWSIKSGAVQYVGRCGLREYVPDLVAMLKNTGFWQKNFPELVSVVTALGQIGDPVVLQALENIVRRRFVLYAKKLDLLKLAIFNSLDLYPAANLAVLLELGQKAGEKNIRLAAQRVILRGMTRPT